MKEVNSIYDLRALESGNSLVQPTRQWSQNVGAGGPHHRCLELIVSSSFNQPMAVERGRSHELVGSMVGAASSHVLGSLPHDSVVYRKYKIVWMGILATVSSFVWTKRMATVEKWKSRAITTASRVFNFFFSHTAESYTRK